MKYYFTSDTHFNQQRTLQLSKRPFQNLDQMNSILVTNWNNLVEEDDTVFHLGDFGDLNFLNRLNGHIVLLLGNYERNNPNFDAQIERFLKTNKVQLRYKPFYLQIGMHPFQLTHQPSLNYEDRKRFQLFGHIHRTQMVKNNALNVGVDCHNFRPISLKEVLWQKDVMEQTMS